MVTGVAAGRELLLAAEVPLRDLAELAHLLGVLGPSALHDGDVDGRVASQLKSERDAGRACSDDADISLEARRIGQPTRIDDHSPFPRALSLWAMRA